MKEGETEDRAGAPPIPGVLKDGYRGSYPPCHENCPISIRDGGSDTDGPLVVGGRGRGGGDDSACEVLFTSPK